MIKYYCEYINDVLTVYSKREDGVKKIISTNHDDITKWISVISLFNSYVIEETNSIELFCNNGRQISMTIVDCQKVLSNPQNEKIKQCIGKIHENGFIRRDKPLHLSKPKKTTDSFVVKKVIPLVLVGGISVMSLSPYQIRTKKTTDHKVFDSMSQVATKVLTPEEIPTNGDLVLKVGENNSYVLTQEDFNKPIEERKEEVIAEPVIEQEEIKIDAHEKEKLMEYFNTDSLELVDSFLGEFVRTMREYGSEYTIDDLVNIFFEVSNIPIEEKVTYVKNAFNLDDAKIDATAATLVAEGVGFGGKYIDVYAATTTALNHLQFPIWVTSISNVRGEELGHNLYGHTCYAPQFNAYGSNNYYTFLGNHDLTGYKAVIDALYINSVYGLVLHNYCQFRGAWIDVPNGKIYEVGGNKYLDPQPSANRVMETMQKNNSTL